MEGTEVILSDETALLPPIIQIGFMLLLLTPLLIVVLISFMRKK